MGYGLGLRVRNLGLFGAQSVREVRTDCLAARPQGPRTEISRALGPKRYNLDDIWALKPLLFGSYIPLYNAHIALYIPL